MSDLGIRPLDWDADGWPIARGWSEDIALPLYGPTLEPQGPGDVRKARLNCGLSTGVSFFRDRKGLEVDLLIEGALGITAAEIKSGLTMAAEFTAALEAFAQRMTAARPRHRVR